MAQHIPQKQYRLIVQLFDPKGWDGTGDRRGQEYRTITQEEPTASDIQEAVHAAYLRHPGTAGWPSVTEVQVIWSTDHEPRG